MYASHPKAGRQLDCGEMPTTSDRSRPTAVGTWSSLSSTSLGMIRRINEVAKQTQTLELGAKAAAPVHCAGVWPNPVNPAGKVKRGGPAAALAVFLSI
jgi:hypothetical protein